MKMVSVSADDISVGQQDKGSNVKTLQRGLAKLRGQGTSPGNTIIANSFENALVIGEQQPDRAVATAVRNAVESLLEDLEII
ncbi:MULTISPECIES: hypothetical protein [unclassified Pseudodesulfovibrio]|uniref:hypothetical protein n=1 Tax=unclassified Pseudodesulfovibrio TaxID=2661612 RepID=UPI000FEBBE02|nr:MULTISPECIES: hypothetical protein [unclassified Pseudodesulfovibrio]MCJ2165232.1 hypothetical protein [Pseudodesulfovibrio sp. S3-i]RWU03285.1 hypothetical protein DWB63_11830 [Pseudodesulfovibrio sp. S3]